jgi:hypothetical protein
MDQRAAESKSITRTFQFACQGQKAELPMGFCSHRERDSFAKLNRDCRAYADASAKALEVRSPSNLCQMCLGFFSTSITMFRMRVSTGGSVSS